MSSAAFDASQMRESIEKFYNKRFREEIGELAQKYPSEQETLRIPFEDLQRYDHELADKWVDDPERVQRQFVQSLNQLTLPFETDFSDARVSLVDLPDFHTYYPGEFSPTDAGGDYLTVEGEVSKATDVYSRMKEAAFRCARCESLTRVPQDDVDELREPHECRSCEREGPFNVALEQSELRDAQTLRIQTPPEVSGGNGQDIDIYVEGELTDVATVGDRVSIPGLVRLDPVKSGRSLTGKFEPWIEGFDIRLENAEKTNLDIEADERERIAELAAGEEGDPLDLAAESLAPKIHGYDHIKRMSVLLAVGGAKAVYSDGNSDRGDFHMLLLGDPGTSKSKILERVEEIVPRSVGVSGSDATGAGITTTATQDDFGDGEWTLEAGAFVQANDGVVCVDEIDDMDRETRSKMLEPMSRQSIHVSKAGINAKLSTEAGVLAAGNPKYGRYDEYEPLTDQFDLNSALLSRFDLIFCPQDKPDPKRDAEIAEHILRARDAAKRQERGMDLDEKDREAIETPVEEDILRKWIALARRQPKPTFESEELLDEVAQSFHDLRAVNGYDTDSPVPVGFRKLEGLVRIAEAAARFELSETITERHTDIARKHIGKSMRDYQQNEDGVLDADIQETGQSKPQKERRAEVQSTVLRLQDGTSGVPIEDVLEEMDAEESKVRKDIEKARTLGIATEPQTGYVRWISKKW